MLVWALIAGRHMRALRLNADRESFLSEISFRSLKKFDWRQALSIFFYSLCPWMTRWRRFSWVICCAISGWCCIDRNRVCFVNRFSRQFSFWQDSLRRHLHEVFCEESHEETTLSIRFLSTWLVDFSRDLVLVIVASSFSSIFFVSKLKAFNATSCITVFSSSCMTWVRNLLFSRSLYSWSIW